MEVMCRPETKDKEGWLGQRHHPELNWEPVGTAMGTINSVIGGTN